MPAPGVPGTEVPTIKIEPDPLYPVLGVGFIQRPRRTMCKNF